MKITYIFPSRSRPTKFFSALENIKTLSESNNYEIIGVLDEDDLTMNNDEVKEKLKSHPEVTVKWGLSNNKIHAINRGAEDLQDGEILIIMSDDIVWDVHGFDNEIRQAFEKNFPNLDGTIHYPDDHGREKTIIVSILGINLYKQFGYLYYPEYSNLFSDNEFTDVTRILGKYIFINKRLFSHNHAIWGTAEWDALYLANENPENYDKDRAIYKYRKSKNFFMANE